MTRASTEFSRIAIVAGLLLAGGEARADTKPGGRQLINAIVEKQADGSWKVSDFGVHDTGTC